MVPRLECYYCASGRALQTGGYNGLNLGLTPPTATRPQPAPVHLDSSPAASIPDKAAEQASLKVEIDSVAKKLETELKLQKQDAPEDEAAQSEPKPKKKAKKPDTTSKETGYTFLGFIVRI